ncbi:MAG: hypothetical protein NZM44_05520, partial [Candidatus Calescibacterium sp.]|nr:hypothetical protein [Candidatus Calescibacterium sp.]
RNLLYKKYPRHAIILDANSKDILERPVLSSLHTPLDIYFYDMGQVPFLPPFEYKLKSFCKCNFHNAKEFFSFVHNKRDSILYLSNDQRTEMIRLLVNEFYGANLLFEKVDSLKLGKSEHIYAYKVSLN